MRRSADRTRPRHFRRGTCSGTEMVREDDDGAPLCGVIAFSLRSRWRLRGASTRSPRPGSGDNRCGAATHRRVAGGAEAMGRSAFRVRCEGRGTRAVYPYRLGDAERCGPTDAQRRRAHLPPADGHHDAFRTWRLVWCGFDRCAVCRRSR